MAKISIISCNAQGLGNTQKRRDVFHYLRQKNNSIYFLQDTHFTEKQEKYIRSEWGYECYFNSFNSQSRGVSILFNNNFDFKIKKEIKDKSGNFLILLMNTQDRDIALVNIYGPNVDNPQFYKDIKHCLSQLTYSGLIIGGDWNLVMDPNLDYHNYRNVNNVKSQEQVVEMMEELSLIDVWREINSDTLRYTWRRPNPFQQARLDFFLISENLLSEVKETDILVSYRSDHSMISLDFMFGKEEKRSNFWKFNASLLKDKKYVETINSTIKEVKGQYSALVYDRENIDRIPIEDLVLNISDQLFLDTLIMEIRKKTIEFSSKKKKEDNKTELELEKEIKDIESKCNLTESDKDILTLKKDELINFRKKKIEGVMIRSKARWSADGEKVTKYFCNLEKRHYVSKSMYKLEKDNGDILYETDDMLNETKSFYEKLYKCQPNNTEYCKEFFTETLPKLDEDSSKNLEGYITLEEASAALKSMTNGKSPGTDGMTVDFFKFFWKQIGGFVVRSINEGFETNKMSITQREGIIVCIPKGDKPREFIKNWRPISLLNVTYKIASSCIANRLKTVLPNLINYDQTGFVPGRYIGDNLRLIYDLMFHLNENNLPGLLVSIDFEKAFDSVNWDYMHMVLKKFGFGDDICRWISTFYNDIRSSVIVNGKASTFFDINRGCRQGDPISPYLFILCAEILAHRVRTENQIIGIDIAETETKISQFADDTTFMLKGDRKSYETLFNILEKFYHLSGLKLNYDKTSNVWLGSKKYTTVTYLDNYRMKWNPSKFKLLGLWFTNDLSSMVEINFTEKFNETIKLFQIWAKRTITPLGRIAILKSLILSKLTYLWLLLPNPPQQVTDEIQSYCYNFVWNNKKDKIKRSLEIHNIEEGGLGLPDISSQIKALKLTWLKKCLRESECSNAKWKNLLHKTCPSISMLKEYGAKVLFRNTNPNPFWRDVFSSYVEFSNSIDDYTDKEILFEPIFFNEKFKIDNKILYFKNWAENNVYFVKDLINENGSFLTFQEFPEQTNIHTSFLYYFGCVSSIKKYIQQKDIKLEDNTSNLKEQGKSYTIIETACRGAKIFYTYLIGKATKPKACNNWEHILNREINWKKIFQTTRKISDVKFKWFQLRINNRILVTNNILKEMNVINDNTCSFCNTVKDSIFHYLWDCDYVQSFWNRLLRYLKEHCNHCTRLEFNPCLILFNFDDNTIVDTVFVKILLTAKFFIYKCRIQKRLPDVDNFLLYLKEIYTIDKFVATMQMNKNKCTVNWAPYMTIIQ